MITQINLSHKYMSELVDAKSLQLVSVVAKMPHSAYSGLSLTFGVDINVHGNDGFYHVIWSRTKDIVTTEIRRQLVDKYYKKPIQLAFVD